MAQMERTPERTPEQRASDPVSGVLLDEEGVIGEPWHDPIALGTALPLPVGVPPNILPIDLADDGPVVFGEVVPDLETLSGAEQSRIEVLTGKRLQRPESSIPDAPPVRSAQERVEKAEKDRADRDRERAQAKPIAPGTPVVRPAQRPATAT
jgi:hypothetical protein